MSFNTEAQVAESERAVSIETLDSAVATWLRFPLIAMIVIIHVSLFYWFPSNHGGWFWGLLSWLFSYDKFPAALATIQLLQDVLTRVAVPLFFFISGYFYFYKTETFDIATWQSKTCSRIKTLLIPYLVWNGISALQFFLRWKFSLEGVGTFNDFLAWVSSLRGGDANVFIGENRPFWGIFYLISAGTIIPNEFLPRPLVGQFWYVRDLFFVGLFSFLWFPLLKNKISASALFLIAGSAWFIFGNDLHVNAQFMTPGIFFFGGGAFFSIHKIRFSEMALRVRWLATLVYFFFAFVDWRWDALGLTNFIGRTQFHNVGILFGMIAAIAWVATGIRSRTLVASRFLTASVFFVFGMHAVSARIFEGLFLQLLPKDSTFWVLSGFILFAVFSLGFSLLVFRVVERFFPILLVPLTGGRGKKTSPLKD